MSLRPDHVEAARPGRWSGALARIATLFDADLVQERADRILMLRGGRYTGAKQPGDGAGHSSFGKCRIEVAIWIRLIYLMSRWTLMAKIGAGIRNRRWQHWCIMTGSPSGARPATWTNRYRRYPSIRRPRFISRLPLTHAVGLATARGQARTPLYPRRPICYRVFARE